jgi:hypothetical protein
MLVLSVSADFLQLGDPCPTLRSKRRTKEKTCWSGPLVDGDLPDGYPDTEHEEIAAYIVKNVGDLLSMLKICRRLQESVYLSLSGIHTRNVLRRDKLFSLPPLGVNGSVSIEQTDGKSGRAHSNNPRAKTRPQRQWPFLEPSDPTIFRPFRTKKSQTHADVACGGLHTRAAMFGDAVF